MIPIETIYKEQLRPLIHVAYDFVKNKQVAEDIVADSFVKLCEAGIIDSPKGWLYQGVKNACLDYLKHKSRVRSVPLVWENSDGELRELKLPSSEYAESRTIYRELLNNLIIEVEQLPERQKEIAIMLLHDLTVREIAKKLKLTVDTIRVSKMRILKKLQFLNNEKPKERGVKYITHNNETMNIEEEKEQGENELIDIKNYLLAIAKKHDIYVDFSDNEYEGDKFCPLDVIGFLDLLDGQLEQHLEVKPEQEEKMFTLAEMVECFNDSSMITYHKNRTMSRVILEDYFKEKFGITIN